MRTKRAFKMKWEAFFVIFKKLSWKQIKQFFWKTKFGDNRIPWSYQISRTSYFRAIYIRAFNFRAVKQFIYSRMNNFRTLTKLIFSRRSKLWMKMFSKTLREICQNTGLSDLYFPVYGQNLIHIFPYLDRIRDIKLLIKV